MNQQYEDVQEVNREEYLHFLHSRTTFGEWPAVGHPRGVISSLGTIQGLRGYDIRLG